jgi:hypothetical protein
MLVAQLAPLSFHPTIRVKDVSVGSPDLGILVDDIEGYCE